MNDERQDGPVEPFQVVTYSIGIEFTSYQVAVR
jgi:hypothetical protein